MEINFRIIEAVYQPEGITTLVINPKDAEILKEKGLLKINHAGEPVFINELDKIIDNIKI